MKFWNTGRMLTNQKIVIIFAVLLFSTVFAHPNLVYSQFAVIEFDEDYKWWELAAAQKFEDVKLAANQGDVSAQYNLGIWYADGLYENKGLPQSDKEAWKWFMLAAKQGYARAQYELGKMCYDGKGVPKNSIESVKFYKLAAAQGHLGAMSRLGGAYYFGDGAILDIQKGCQLWREAGELGDSMAIEAYNNFCVGPR